MTSERRIYLELA